MILVPFRLLEKSEQFNLHADSQQFVVRLYIDLISNNCWGKTNELSGLQSALMDLTFALFNKRNETMDVVKTAPSGVQYLFVLTQIINLLMKKSQQFQWFELLLSVLPEMSSALDDESTVNREMIEASNPHFDSLIVDCQLMKMINEKLNLDWVPLPHDEILGFIKRLPEETTTDKILFQSFTRLCEIPSVHIKTRVKFIYLFNILCQKLLPMINLSLGSGESGLVDKIRTARYHILLLQKNALLTEALNKTKIPLSTTVEITFDVVKAKTGENPDDTMFSQAYKQLMKHAGTLFRRDTDEQLWSAKYVGMFSIDRGGPYRDSISRMCDELCSTLLPLFILCPNGRTNVGLNRDRWIPNVFPLNEPIRDQIKNQYRFVGQLMGMAIRTKNYLEVRFARLVWKQLIYDPVTIEDIEDVDIQSFTNINEMEENVRKVKAGKPIKDDGNKIDLDYLFSSIMSELQFDVVSSSGEKYELIPYGFQIPITSSNFENYCLLYRQYRLNEFRRQIDAIQQGLFSIVPSAYLTLFTSSELEEAVCGKSRIDVDLLKRHTSYESDDETMPHIENFWKILSELFTEEQRKLFLIFVWGRGTLPIRDEDFTTEFQITRLEPDGDVDEALPSKNLVFFKSRIERYGPHIDIDLIRTVDWTP